jgi:tetratricopeptide (TPR) repeat protein
MQNTTEKKIFISHSRKDMQLGETIVQLLLDIGIKEEQIVFTSNPKYGIPLGYSIFRYLKEQIHNNAYMIYLLSDNYYNSAACLNEMGAAWIIQNEHILLAIPEFDFNGAKFRNSAVDTTEMGTVINDKVRMRQFAEKIITSFELTESHIQEALDQYFIRLQEAMKIRPVKYMMDLMRVEREIKEGSKLDEKYNLKGSLLYDTQRENYPAAFQNCLYALYLNPNYKEGYSRLVQMGVCQKEYDKALSIAEEMCRKFPNYAISYGSRGFAKVNKGTCIDEAIEDLTFAISLDPYHWWYYITRGLCYMQEGETRRDEALSDFWAAYKLNPQYDSSVSNIKKICKNTGLKEMCEIAINHKESALSAKAGNDKQKEKEEKEKARMYFDSILLTDSKDETGLREYGGYYYDFEDYETAQKYWKAALDVRKCCAHYYLYGLTLELSQKTSQAMEFYREALGYPDDGYLGEVRKHLDKISLNQS